jgi:tetratricopeptide (TPR) repeat protein
MTNTDRRDKSPSESTLSQLCSLVIAMKTPFEDLAEFIEDKSYEACDKGQIDKVVHQLRRLAEFFERMENKNEENCRDLADVYILIGEIYQCHEQFSDSVEWFKRATVVNDRYALPYHSLAVSFLRLRDLAGAAKSLEQEISLAPGNYYSYLMLADVYESQGEHDKSEEKLNKLLERDPNNVQALHRIIVHCEQEHPELEVELLRRRLISVRRNFNKVETAIWVYHMCRMKRYSEALQYLASRENESPDISIVHLLKAHIYGEMRQFTKKKSELVKFKSKNDGNDSYMGAKLKEFGDVFGEKAVARLSKRLTISHHGMAHEATPGLVG